MQDKVSVSVFSVTYVEPYETHVVQGGRELQCIGIKSDGQNAVRTRARRGVLAKKIGDQLSPLVRNKAIALACATGHTLIDKYHDDLALGSKVDRRGRTPV
ncbi:hypothetical protein BRAO375_4180014 [Bradyrhizobium sp. ORS 375]|nr:hypothetical protein BRAO375_4180014 [Bradyrhizobium sp. ORS 375]